MQRSLLYGKQRRSLSMLNPSKKQKLNELLVDGGNQNEPNKILGMTDIEDKLGNVHRDSGKIAMDNMLEFTDERPNNTIFLETSKE